MIVEFKDILDAFDFVSFGSLGEHQAYLNKENGKIYWHSEFGDNIEELPEDIGDEKYIEIPHKQDLGLGKKLVLRFSYQHFPDDVDEIESIFRRKGAYAKFKNFLEKKGVIDKWYQFELQAQENALREWCEIREIQVHG